MPILSGILNYNALVFFFTTIYNATMSTSAEYYSGNQNGHENEDAPPFSKKEEIALMFGVALTAVAALIVCL